MMIKGHKEEEKSMCCFLRVKGDQADMVLDNVTLDPVYVFEM